MYEPLWRMIFVVGIVHGIYFGAVLLLRRHTNRRAGRWLALLVACLALSLLAGLLRDQFTPRLALLVMFLNTNTELTIGPLVFLFVRSIVTPDRRASLADMLHFLPFTGSTLAWGIAWFGVSDSTPLLHNGLDSLDSAPYFLTFKACVLAGYVVYSCQLLARVEREGMGRRSPDAGWLRRWLIRLSMIPGAIYTLTFLEQWDMAPQVEADEIGGALIAALIFLAGSLFLFRPSLLAALPRKAHRGTPDRAAMRLLSCLDEQRPWLDPELTLGVLAEMLGMADKELSAVINHDLDTTFYALLGRYRLAEFRRLAADPAQCRRSVLVLAYDAGFNSKASFYRAFRERYRTTPTAWRSEVLRTALAASQRTQ